MSEKNQKRGTEIKEGNVFRMERDGLQCQKQKGQSSMQGSLDLLIRSFVVLENSVFQTEFYEAGSLLGL